MAETVSRRGGIAVIPQDIPTDVVANVVRKVKGSHPVYDTPVSVTPRTTVGGVAAAGCSVEACCWGSRPVAAAPWAISLRHA